MDYVGESQIHGRKQALPGPRLTGEEVEVPGLATFLRCTAGKEYSRSLTPSPQSVSIVFWCLTDRAVLSLTQFWIKMESDCHLSLVPLHFLGTNNFQNMFTLNYLIWSSHKCLSEGGPRVLSFQEDAEKWSSSLWLKGARPGISCARCHWSPHLNPVTMQIHLQGKEGKSVRTIVKGKFYMFIATPYGNPKSKVSPGWRSGDLKYAVFVF